ncbi:MAG: 3-isopropylmalate dehydratase small subunit [Burkholderiaceae bacterium]|nr:3-isopropylmalate dehydratase small subunit [Burkholderiaceae bacterium]
MKPPPFVTHRGIVAPLDAANVDTDAIFPKQYGRSIAASGFGPVLFDNWRYLDPGDLDSDHSKRRENPDFVLNREPWRRATVLLARENFGCGSSREHAVWALRDFGFRAIVAPSFASIFAGNAIANGLLTIALPSNDVDALFEWVCAQRVPEAEIDLPQQHLRAGGLEWRFDIAPRAKQSLLCGWDEIERTLQRSEEIRAFEARRLGGQPWLRVVPKA